jgi:hypothetical protein
VTAWLRSPQSSGPAEMIWCFYLPAKEEKLEPKSASCNQTLLKVKLAGGCEIGLIKIALEICAWPAGITNAFQDRRHDRCLRHVGGFALCTPQIMGAFISGMIQTGHWARARSVSHTAAAFILFS